MNSDHSLPRRFKTPEGLRLGHDDARAELVRVSSMDSFVGEAARFLARICLPHFEHEEKFVFPVFGLLPELALGRVRPEMAEALPLIASFGSWHETFDSQHQSIGAAVHALLTAGYKENNREAIEFGYCLRAHERMEHQVIFPTVFLIGKYVQEKLGL